MSIRGALSQIGIDEHLYLACGEVLDTLNDYSRRVGGIPQPMRRTELIERMTDLATGPSGLLPHELRDRFERVQVGMMMLTDAIDALVDLGMLTERDGAVNRGGCVQCQGCEMCDWCGKDVSRTRRDERWISFTIMPGFSFDHHGRGSERNAQAQMRADALRRIASVPAGTIFHTTAPGDGHGQLRRSTNVRVNHIMDWCINRGRSGAGVHWSPPAIVYPGSGGYWRECYAVGDLAKIMAEAINSVELAPA